MILYHVTSLPDALAIKQNGFEDRGGHYLTSSVHRGVWLSDRPIDENDGATCSDATLVIELNVAAAELSAYEWSEEGKSYREWLVPAEVIRKRGLVRLSETSTGPAAFG